MRVLYGLCCDVRLDQHFATNGERGMYGTYAYLLFLFIIVF